MADSDQQSQLIKAGAILSLPKSQSNESQKIKGAMGNPFRIVSRFFDNLSRSYRR
jgi:hypothetical protein